MCYVLNNAETSDKCQIEHGNNAIQYNYESTINSYSWVMAEMSSGGTSRFRLNCNVINNSLEPMNFAVSTNIQI